MVSIKDSKMAPKPGCWKRMTAPIMNVMSSGISAETLALSFALGISCGVFPVPGITSVIGGIFCWLLRGNILASTAVNYVMTPFLFMCLVPFIRAGEWLFGVAEPVPFSLEPFSESLLGAIKLYSAVLARATCAWLIFMPIATFVLYHILLVILRPILASQQKTTA